jgi:hypothetical protein
MVGDVTTQVAMKQCSFVDVLLFEVTHPHLKIWQ